MSGSLGSLVVSIAADTAEFQSDMGKAAHIAERNFQSMITQASAFGTALGQAMYDAAKGLANLAVEQLNTADSFNKTAQKVGMAVEQFSALAYAARLADVDTESLKGALVKLNDKMLDAASGSKEAVATFNALGIKVTDANGKLRSTADVFNDLADAFAKMDENGKSGMATRLSRNMADLIPLLNGGSAGLAQAREEAEQLGVVMSGQLTQSAETFKDNLTRLKAAQEGFSNQVMQSVLPTLVSFSEAMVTAAKNSDGFSRSVGALRTSLETVMVLGYEVNYTLGGLGRQLGAYSAAFEALSRGDFKGLSAISKALREDNLKAEDERKKFLEGVMNPTTGVAAQVEKAANSGSGVAINKLKDVKTETDKAGKRLVELVQEAALLGKTGAELELLKFQMLGATDVQVKYAEQVLTTIEAHKKQAKAVEEGKRVYEETRTPLEKLAAEQEKLQKLLDQGAIIWDTYARAVLDADEKAQAAMEGTSTDFGELQRAIEGWGKDSARAMSEFAFGVEQDVGGMVKKVMMDISTMLIYANVTKPLFAAIQGSDFVSSIGSFFGARATGGPVASGQAYLVGEHGPEVFVPQGAGTVVPGGAGGVMVNVSVDASGSAVQGNNEDASRLGQMIAGAVRSVLIEEQRPGGLLN